MRTSNTKSSYMFYFVNQTINNINWVDLERTQKLLTYLLKSNIEIPRSTKGITFTYYSLSDDFFFFFLIGNTNFI